MEALYVILCIFFFPSYYLWTRGYKKTLLAFIGVIFSLFVFVAGILVEDTPLMIGSVVFVPLCFCLYLLYSNRGRIAESFRKRQYSSRESLFWTLPIGVVGFWLIVVLLYALGHISSGALYAIMIFISVSLGINKKTTWLGVYLLLFFPLYISIFTFSAWLIIPSLLFLVLCYVAR